MTDIDLIHERLAPINAAMPQVLTTARDGAMRAMNTMGLPRHEYRALYANNFIGVARNTMPDVLEECDWEIAAARNTLQLVDKDTGLRVRLLKRFAIEGAVPPAGHNAARRQAWSQQSLLDEQPSGKKPFEAVHLVLIWHEEGSELSCAACYVRTDNRENADLGLQAGRFPHAAKAEMIAKIPVTLPADEFAGLRFDTKEPRQTLTPVRNTVVEHAHIEI